MKFMTDRNAHDRENQPTHIIYDDRDYLYCRRQHLLLFIYFFLTQQSVAILFNI